MHEYAIKTFFLKYSTVTIAARSVHMLPIPIWFSLRITTTSNPLKPWVEILKRGAERFCFSVLVIQVSCWMQLSVYWRQCYCVGQEEGPINKCLPCEAPRVPISFRLRILYFIAWPPSFLVHQEWRVSRTFWMDNTAHHRRMFVVKYRRSSRWHNHSWRD
jgi:hypothetical protein